MILDMESQNFRRNQFRKLNTINRRTWRGCFYGFRQNIQCVRQSSYKCLFIDPRETCDSNQQKENKGNIMRTICKK
ncbi:unnamed protein product [Paramecium primaurelia]|uniref:Uncharacterized protein n=1 Tax=Paramecium primaurelia TaxID=5886 RepID=A0A8S1PGZ2_PARPR|nr:unnamed protein product [Paramecium primaurelia]